LVQPSKQFSTHLPTDVLIPEPAKLVQQRLRKMGVERALARAGAREGDVVRVGPVELDYVEGFG
jgi:GTP-binding protein